MKTTVGVMGTSNGKTTEEARKKTFELGRAIARADCILVTGACPGLPYEAVKGAKLEGGLVVGVSPATTIEEHVTEYCSPVEGFDVMVYTGSGLMGREVINVRSSDVVIITGGRSGTLGEFAIAYEECRPIGVLLGSGGVADGVSAIVEHCFKPGCSIIIYESDPQLLLDRLLQHYNSVRPSRASHAGSTSPADAAS